MAKRTSTKSVVFVPVRESAYRLMSFSNSLNKSLGRHPSGSDNAKRVVRVGWRCPRSKSEMYVRSRPASKDKASWDRPLAVRLRCKTFPNAAWIVTQTVCLN